MTGTPCPACGQATTDGLVCDPCVRAYLRDLEALARLWPELDVTTARMDKVSRAVRHGLTGQPVTGADEGECGGVVAWLRSRDEHTPPGTRGLPVNLDAAEVAAEIRDLLAALLTSLHGARVTAADRLGAAHRAPDRLAGPTCPPHAHDGSCRWRDCRVPLHCRHASCRAVRARAASRRDLAWLAGGTAVHQLRRHDQAPAWLRELGRLVGRVERVVDAREPELFLGRCDAPDVRADLALDGTVEVDVAAACGADLYARAGDAVVVCMVCGFEYPIVERRQAMLDAVRDVLARPRVIAEALTSLDLPITASTLDVWISRDRRLYEQGRVRADGLPLILADPVTDEAGKSLYRVGSVLDRVEVMLLRSREHASA